MRRQRIVSLVLVFRTFSAVFCKFHLHHFWSDSINNMDHISIFDTEPSSVIPSHTSEWDWLFNVTCNNISVVRSLKSRKVMPQKCQKKVEAKRDGLINPQNYNFNQFLTRKVLMLSKCYESTEVDRRTWLHVSSGALWSTSSDTHQVVEI